MYSVAIVYKADTPTVSRFGQAWFDSAYGYSDPVYVNVVNDPNQQGVQDLIQKAQINEYPTILFLKDAPGGQNIITRLEGEHSYNTILQVMQDVPAGLYEEGTDPDGTPEGKGLINWNELFSSPLLLIVSGLIIYQKFLKD